MHPHDQHMCVPMLCVCVCERNEEHEEIVVGVEGGGGVGGWMGGTESMCCMTLVTAEGT